MKVTLELLQILQHKGWRIDILGEKIPLTPFSVIYWQPPQERNGLPFSSADHHAVDLEEFPKAVEAWIWENVPMTTPEGQAGARLVSGD